MPEAYRYDHVCRHCARGDHRNCLDETTGGKRNVCSCSNDMHTSHYDEHGQLKWVED